MEQFYNDIKEKIDLNKIMRLQIDLQFQQRKIKKLNKKYNFEIFSTRLKGGKALAAEQKIRELQKLLLKTKNINKKNKTKI